jgi:DNA (cytosine-5)-methyltransferase 1
LRCLHRELENNKPNKHVDNTKAITHLGLCAGYGGIELGLKRVIPTLRSVALCEIEAFACANLVAKMEAGLMDCAPIWSNLKTFPWAEFCDRVDILTGGYPCQPFSAAGKRLGTEDPRHLWPFIAAGIRLMRPRVCFFENVEGHVSLGLRAVLSELEEIGYRTTWGLFSASEVGAPHQRKRVFILAVRRELAHAGYLPRYAEQWQQQEEHTEELQGGVELADRDSGRGGENLLRPELRATGPVESPSGSRLLSAEGQAGEVSVWPSRPGEPQHDWEPPRVVNSTGARQQAQRDESNGERRGGSTGESGELGNANSTRPQERQGQRVSRLQGTHADGGEDAEWQTQPTLGRGFDEFTRGVDYAELHVSCDNRTDELRLLGNGVVPATAALAFRTLAARLGVLSHE